MDSLSSEVLWHVFSHLDTQALALCTFVCKQWYSVASTDYLWFRHCTDWCQSKFHGVDAQVQSEHLQQFKGSWKTVYNNIVKPWFDMFEAQVEIQDDSANVISSFTNCLLLLVTQKDHASGIVSRNENFVVVSPNLKTLMMQFKLDDIINVAFDDQNYLLNIKCHPANARHFGFPSSEFHFLRILFHERSSQQAYVIATTLKKHLYMLYGMYYHDEAEEDRHNQLTMHDYYHTDDIGPANWGFDD